MSISERGKYRLPLKSEVPVVERCVRQEVSLEGKDGKCYSVEEEEESFPEGEV